MILEIDEIYKRAIPYREYFGVMKLTKKQMEDRIAFAEYMEDELVTIYYLFSTMKKLDVANDKLIKKELEQVYLDALTYSGIAFDDYLLERARTFALEFYTATKDHVGNILTDPTLTPSQKWYLSADRLMFNAENEANTALNYKEYTEAKKRGFTKKRWLTENDNRVRDTHIPLEGETIGINELFVVGESLMRFPHDYEYCTDASEICNCRCSIKYI